MDAQIKALNDAFDSIRRVSPTGSEYWMARDLQLVLEYTNWENFENVIQKAKMACQGAGVAADNHFLASEKMVGLGSGAQRGVLDYFLSRYACYLIAMNGDSTKQPIAVAQNYFAIQTRRQELDDVQKRIEKRVELRKRVSNANKALNAAAKKAGVQNYGLFHDAGYRGLYGGIGLSEIKQRKKIEGELLDHAGRAELAANEFRITQTEQKIALENISGEPNAINTHKTVGAEVRATIKKLGGTMPEDLPPEQSLKKLTSKKHAKLAKPDSIK
jgi:DNA-damage-inducible protein D